MNYRSVAHGSFSLERTYPTTPQHVFAAWASHTAKNPWFGEGDDFLSRTDEYTLDFRIGGHERLTGILPSGKAFSYEAVYQDIVGDERIIASYDVCIDDRRTSVSLLTVGLHRVPTGTTVILTEQGAFLDGLDSNDQRQEGAADSLDKLGSYLQAALLTGRESSVDESPASAERASETRT